MKNDVARLAEKMLTPPQFPDPPPTSPPRPNPPVPSQDSNIQTPVDTVFAQKPSPTSLKHSASSHFTAGIRRLGSLRRNDSKSTRATRGQSTIFISTSPPKINPDDIKLSISAGEYIDELLSTSYATVPSLPLQQPPYPNHMPNPNTRRSSRSTWQTRTSTRTTRTDHLKDTVTLEQCAVVVAGELGFGSWTEKEMERRGKDMGLLGVTLPENVHFHADVKVVMRYRDQRRRRDTLESPL